MEAYTGKPDLEDPPTRTGVSSKPPDFDLPSSRIIRRQSFPPSHDVINSDIRAKAIASCDCEWCWPVTHASLEQAWTAAADRFEAQQASLGVRIAPHRLPSGEEMPTTVSSSYPDDVIQTAKRSSTGASILPGVDIPTADPSAPQSTKSPVGPANTSDDHTVDSPEGYRYLLRPGSGRGSPHHSNNWSTTSLAGSVEEKKAGFVGGVLKRWDQWITTTVQHRQDRHDARRRRRQAGRPADGWEHITSVYLGEALRGSPDGAESTESVEDRIKGSQTSGDDSSDKISSLRIVPGGGRRQLGKVAQSSSAAEPQPLCTSPDSSRLYRSLGVLNMPPAVDIIPDRSSSAESFLERRSSHGEVQELRSSDRSAERRNIVNTPHELSSTPDQVAEERRGRHRDCKYLTGFSSTGEMIVTHIQPRTVRRHRTASGKRSSWKQPPLTIVPVAEEEGSPDNT